MFGGNNPLFFPPPKSQTSKQKGVTIKIRMLKFKQEDPNNHTDFNRITMWLSIYKQNFLKLSYFLAVFKSYCLLCVFSNVIEISELDFTCHNIYNMALRKVLECSWIPNRMMDFTESFEKLKEEEYQCFV